MREGYVELKLSPAQKDWLTRTLVRGDLCSKYHNRGNDTPHSDLTVEQIGDHSCYSCRWGHLLE